MLWKPAFKSSMLTHFAQSELGPVPPCIVELILILSHPFVDRVNVLTHSVGLPGLDARD